MGGIFVDEKLIRTIKNFKVGFIGLVLFGVGIFSIWLSYRFTGIEHDILRDVGIALAPSGLVVTFFHLWVLDEFTSLGAKKNKKEIENFLISLLNDKIHSVGITDFFINRETGDQLNSFSMMINNAKSEIFIVGVTLNEVPSNNRSIFVKKALNKCKLEFLMLNPIYFKNEFPKIDPTTTHDLKGPFSHAIKSFRRLAVDIAKSTNDKDIRFEVKFYDQSPTMSLVFCDKMEMHVELSPHNKDLLDAKFRPLFKIKKITENDLFESFYDNYRDLWEHHDITSYIKLEGSKIILTGDNEISEMLNIERFSHDYQKEINDKMIKIIEK